MSLSLQRSLLVALTDRLPLAAYFGLTKSGCTSSGQLSAFAVSFYALCYAMAAARPVLPPCSSGLFAHFFFLLVRPCFGGSLLVRRRGKWFLGWRTRSPLPSYSVCFSAPAFITLPLEEKACGQSVALACRNVVACDHHLGC